MPFYDTVGFSGRGEDYLKNPSFLGVVIGPNANRTGNASFRIDDREYQLDVNFISFAPLIAHIAAACS